jgi:ParB family chromosome partitioning protein
VAQKPVLGKGLASLLPGAAPAASSLTSSVMGAPSAASPTIGQASSMMAAGATVAGAVSHTERLAGITMLSIEELEANEYQPRRSFDDATLAELAQSIKANGVIQPLVVRRTSDGYQLIAGERRLRASKLAGLKQVPVVVRRSTDKEALEMALVENIQRENLNCIDEALAYQQLMDEFQLTQEEAAARVGKERASVANYLRLLRLPEAIIDDLKKGALSFGHGKALLMLEDQDSRLELRKRIIETKLSVRQAEAEAHAIKQKVAGGQTGPLAATPVAPQDPVQQRLAQLSQELTRRWSAKVELKGSRKKGKILIHYDNAEQLERILAGMQNSSVWENPRT